MPPSVNTFISLALSVTELEPTPATLFSTPSTSFLLLASFAM